MAETMQAHRCRSCEASSSICQSLELSLAATSSQPVEPARRFGRGKLDRGWPEWLVVLAERAGTMACRGKLDRGWPERLFVLAERAGTIGWSSWLVELARFAGPRALQAIHSGSLGRRAGMIGWSSWLVELARFAGRRALPRSLEQARGC